MFTVAPGAENMYNTRKAEGTVSELLNRRKVGRFSRRRRRGVLHLEAVVQHGSTAKVGRGTAHVGTLGINLGELSSTQMINNSTTKRITEHVH